MTLLTHDNVNGIFLDSLFREEEIIKNPVIAEGLTVKIDFHPERLASHKAEIKELLSQLPKQFHAGKGDGWSFLNACVRQDGKQWGEHINVEQLMTLGIATGQAKLLLPRNLWPVFPGGMPYFAVYL